ncbi:MAG: toll/interleukin-1 receptor domain-containing protein [Anaerolineae bacterium]
MTETSAPPKRKIFISYRRADNPDFVERIRDWFAWKYGRDSVFMDFDAIPPFTLFADYIREKVRECDLLVAIIGPEWMRLMQERIHQQDDEDYVRLEIKLALEEQKPIAPICIKKAGEPRKKDVPSELRQMLDYNVAYLDSGRHFLDNIEMILDAVESQLVRLDAWKVMAHVQTVQFDVMKAIEKYQEAADGTDWKTALDWLARIRESGFAPDWYPLEDYEQEAREALHLQAAAAGYQFVRAMAERALKKPEEQERVWMALEAFWRDYPAYDPDDLAAHFRPAPMPAESLDENIDARKLAAAPEFDFALLDKLSDFAASLNDDILSPENLARVAKQTSSDERTLSLEEAEKSGILDWQT